MVSHWSLSDSKSPHVFMTLLSILADINNAILWMVSTRPLNSKLSSPFINSFGDSTDRTNYHWYNCHFHIPQFFQFPNKVKLLIFLFVFFQFYSVVSQDSKVHNPTSSLFLMTITRSGRLDEIRWSVCISKSQWSWCVSIFQVRFWVVLIPLVHMIKFQFLLNS